MYVPHPIVSVPHPEMRGRAAPAMAAVVEVTTGSGARATEAARRLAAS